MSDLPIYQGQVFGVDGGNSYAGGSGLSDFIFTNYGKFVGTVSTPTTTPTLQIDILNSGVTAGTYGASGVIPVITVDAKGIISSVTTVSGGSGGGSGTVTQFNFTNQNGIIGTVSTATTTPTLGLSLGSITPTSIVASGTITGSNLSGTNTGDQNLFRTIAVAGQSDVVADSTTDTLTLEAGANITITTDALTDKITIAASGGGGTSSGTVTNFSFNNVNGFTGTVSTATSTPSLSLIQQNASGSQTGLLTATDWNTFNSKGSGTVTSVSVTNNGNITGTVSTATTTPAIAVNLTDTGVTAGTYGNNGQIPRITFDAKGRATAVSTVSGGFLSNFTYTNNGNITGTVSTGTSTPVLTTDLTNSGVTAGTYGSATVIPVITVNNKGITTSVTTVSSSGGTASGTVTSFSFTNANGFTGTVSTSTTTPTLTLDYRGGRVLLNETIISTPAASVNFTSLISSAYSTYIIEFISIVPATGDTTLMFRASTNNGVSFLATQADYADTGWATNLVPGVSTSQSVMAIGNVFCFSNLAGTGWGISNTGSRGGSSGEVTFYNLNSTTAWKQAVGRSAWQLSGAANAGGQASFGGTCNTTSAVNALQVLMNSGNIASGTLRLWGVR